jgi:hypothetical protein
MIPKEISIRKMRSDVRDAAQRASRTLTRRQSELYREAYSLNNCVLIELPEPVFWGWERYFFVSPDLAHSTEGPALEKVLNLTQNVECSNRKDFAVRDWTRGGKKYPSVHRLREIDERDFFDPDKVDVKLRPYFQQVTHRGGAK